MTPELTLLASAFVLALGLTLLSERLGRRLKIYDEPDRPLTIHDRPVPRTGGVALMVAMGLATLLGSTLGISLLTVPELAAAGMLFALGLWDDVRPRPAKLRLVLQVVIYAVAWSLGVRIELFGVPAADAAFGLVTFVVVINAVNFYDGMDGLTGLTAAAALGIWSALALEAGYAWLTPAVISAMLLAFLIRNWHPAKIFLGDSGSFLVGFALYLVFVHAEPTATGMIPAFWVSAVPVCDAVAASVDRLARRADPWSGDRDHIYDILSRRGLTPGRVAAVLGLMAAILARASEKAAVLPPAAAWLVTAFVYAALIGLVWRLRNRFRLPPTG